MTSTELKNKGNEYFRKGDFKKAIEYYEKALLICSDDEKHIFHSNSAASYLLLQDYERSLSHSTQCVKYSPNFEKGYIRLIRSYIGLGEYQLANSYIHSHIRNETSKENLIKTIRSVSPQANYTLTSVPLKSEKIKFHKIGMGMGFGNDEELDNVPKDITLFVKYNLFSYNSKIYSLGGGAYGGYESNDLLKLEGQTFKIQKTKNPETFNTYPYSLSERKICFDLVNSVLYVWDGIIMGNKYFVYILDMSTLEWTRLPQIMFPESFAMNCSSFFGCSRNKLYVSIVCNQNYDAYSMYGNSDNYNHDENDDDHKNGIIFSRNLDSSDTQDWELKELPKKTCSVSMVELLKDLEGSVIRKFRGCDCAVLFWRPDGIQPIIFNLEKGNTEIIDLETPTYFLKKQRHNDEAIDKNYCGINARKKSKKSIPILYCNYLSSASKYQENTLLCLFNERYLLELDFEKLKWMEVGSPLSNTLVVDGLISSKLQKLWSYSIPIDNPEAPMIMTRKQFHSMIWNSGNNILHIFPRSVHFPFSDVQRNMFLVRIDSDRNTNMKKTFLQTRKSKIFCDCSIVCKK